MIISNLVRVVKIDQLQAVASGSSKGNLVWKPQTPVQDCQKESRLYIAIVVILMLCDFSSIRGDTDLHIVDAEHDQKHL